MLDGRVARKATGTLIASLPPDCPRTELLDDVAEFWARATGPTACTATPRCHDGTAIHVLVAAPTWSGSIPFGIVLARAKGVNLRRSAAATSARPTSARALGKGSASRCCWSTPPRASCPSGSGRHFEVPPRRSSPRRWRGNRRTHVHAVPARPRRQGRRDVAGASRWRCRRSRRSSASARYVVIFAATRLSSLGSLVGMWTFSMLFVARSAAPPAHRAGDRRRVAGDVAPPRKHRAPGPRRRETDVGATARGRAGRPRRRPAAAARSSGSPCARACGPWRRRASDKRGCRSGRNRTAAPSAARRAIEVGSVVTLTVLQDSVRMVPVATSSGPAKQEQHTGHSLPHSQAQAPESGIW